MSCHLCHNSHLTCSQLPAVTWQLQEVGHKKQLFCLVGINMQAELPFLGISRVSIQYKPVYKL